MAPVVECVCAVVGVSGFSVQDGMGGEESKVGEGDGMGWTECSNCGDM